jgi:hypothetical protein
VAAKNRKEMKMEGMSTVYEGGNEISFKRIALLHQKRNGYLIQKNNERGKRIRRRWVRIKEFNFSFWIEARIWTKTSNLENWRSI